MAPYVFLLSLAPLSLWCSVSFAAKYSYFNCGDKLVATGDCRMCKEERDVEVELLLNRAQNSVMKKFYLKDKNGTTKLVSNVSNGCNIFDDKNWQCKTKDSGRLNDRVTHELTSIDEMTDGVFKSSVQSCWFVGPTMKCSYDASYCGIKKGFLSF